MATMAFYDFSEWHRGPGCRVEAVPCSGGCGVMLLCVPCGKAADLQGLGGACSLIESAQVRLEAQPVG